MSQIEKENPLLKSAIEAHRAGQLDIAKNLYLQSLSEFPDGLEAIHNLGMLNIEQGNFKTGLGYIEQIKPQILDQAQHLATYKILATKLYEKRLWEDAAIWIQQVLVLEPSDQQMQAMRSRISPRDYLQADYFDQTSQQTLLRYSPKESETYIYTIDIAGTCNLRCPSCPVGNTELGGRTVGNMSEQLFTEILTKIKKETPTEKPQIWLYNWGEPLLHPKLASFIQEIRDFGFTSHLSTNLNMRKDFSKLVAAEPDEIKISLSGFSQQTYGKTHKRGNINLLKGNMHLLRYELDKQNKSSHVWVGQHVYKNNLHEVEPVKNICEELNFAHHPIQAFFQPIEKLVRLMQGETNQNDQDLLNELLVNPKEYIEQIRQHRSGRYDCELRFNQTVINYDGEVALCCSVYEKPNMLGIQFLDHSHQQIEAKKYQHDFCKTCRKHGCDYSYTEAMDKRDNDAS